MDQIKKDTAKAAIPANAVKVWEYGQWTVFWSNPDKFFYITSLASPSSVLRLSRDKLLSLSHGLETRSSDGNDVAAMMPIVQEGIISLSQRDKRRFRRFTRRCEAEFSCGGVSKKGIASDFSINGLFIRTGSPFAPDEVIDIIVHLPDNSISFLQGKIKRTMKSPLGTITGTMTRAYKNGMGVAITDRDANYLHFIRSMIK